MLLLVHCTCSWCPTWINLLRAISDFLFAYYCFTPLKDGCPVSNLYRKWTTSISFIITCLIVIISRRLSWFKVHKGSTLCVVVLLLFILNYINLVLRFRTASFTFFLSKSHAVLMFIFLLQNWSHCPRFWLAASRYQEENRPTEAEFTITQHKHSL